MYANPVLLPPYTNREDFYLPLSLFDDDLGTAINLSGVTLANPGSSFTASAWTIVGGNIATTSATSITIPTFPIGNQLSALALTVGTGLGIKAGDPVTISDTATGLNSMVGYVTSYGSNNGALIVQIGVTFQFEIRRGRPWEANAGYGPWFDFGIQTDLGPLLSASLGNGITITDIGYILILIPESQFKQLSNDTRTYMAALTMTDSVFTRQIAIFQLPVLYGGVTT